MGEGAEEEGERGFQADSLLSTEPDQGPGPRTPRP